MMTNGEKNKKRFDELGIGDWPAFEIAHRIAVRKNGDVDLCDRISCYDCIFKCGNCIKEAEKWLTDEAETDEPTPEQKEEKMKKDEIKIGDTVKVTMKSHIKEGETGTVRMIRRTEAGKKLYFVVFDGEICGYALLEYEIEKVKRKKTPPRVVIYQDGMTVTAKDLETGEEESAVCSKNDTFDFYTGSFIALSRLTGHAYMLPVMMGDIELMERDLADFKNRVKAMMGDGDMWPCDDFFNEKGKK